LTTGVILLGDEKVAPPAAGKRLLRRLLRRPLGVAALAYLLIVITAAVFAPLLAPYGSTSIDLLHVLQGPSPTHWLGTDAIGRDLLSRLIFGARPTLVGVLIATATAVAIAVPVGTGAAMAQRMDRVVSPVVDTFMSVPAIVVLLMVLATFGQNIPAAMVTLGVLTAPGMTRVVRGASLSVVEEPYIAAARVFGLRRTSIAVRHVMPRIAGPLLVNSSLVASAALITETGLNFLGLGTRPPAPTWGSMVADGSSVMDETTWPLLVAGGAVIITVVALVLLGDALRDTVTETWTGRPRHRAGRHSLVTTPRTVQRAPVSGPAADATEARNGQAPLLSVRDLTVAFPGPAAVPVPVLQHVSFDVGPGETLGVVGESGCGKTMTALAVIGMLPPAAQVLGGEILLNGRDVLTTPKKERARLRGSKIAFVSQEPMVALDPLFTVGSQVAEAVRRHARTSRSAARRAAIDLLDRVKIRAPEKVVKLYPHEISGGTAQRVCIAIALAGHPDLLVADEPTTALDVTVQAEILALLGSVQRESGMAIVLISHDWAVIRQLCSRSVVMYAGEVVERGSTSDVMHEPSHPYTEALLSADPHLAVPGTRLSTIPGTVPQPHEWPTGCHFAERCAYATAECAKGPVPLVAADGNRVARCIYAGRLPVRSGP
jgi:peptide/nickel transport system permease protein